MHYDLLGIARCRLTKKDLTATYVDLNTQLIKSQELTNVSTTALRLTWDHLTIDYTYIPAGTGNDYPTAYNRLTLIKLAGIPCQKCWILSLSSYAAQCVDKIATKTVDQKSDDI